MTALARSIGTQDTVLYLSSSLDVGSLPAPFLVDAECILVTGGDMQSQVFVSRGQFGTAPEAHDVGATLVSGWGSTNGPVTLAQVLANGNDTGGVGIVSDATGSDNADASTTATSVDGTAIATTTATASGVGGVDVSSTATAGGLGQALAKTTARVPDDSVADATVAAYGESDSVIATAVLTVGGGSADARVNAQADATGYADVSRSAVSNDGNATATTTATASGTGGADASTTATTVSGHATVNRTATTGTGTADASLQAIAGTSGDSTSGLAVFNGDGPQNLTFGLRAPGSGTGNAEIQVNGLPLITTGSGAPGASFVSLLYVDTTAVTGGGYCWDFVSGAYIKIGTV